MESEFSNARSAPLLGLICCSRDVGGEQGQSVMNRYVRAASHYAEATTLLIPCLEGAASPAQVAEHLDGLLLTGSPSNIEPHHYGSNGANVDGPYDPARDRMVFALLEEFIARGKPVFGICRGLQEINVAFGGTLNADVASGGDALNHHAPAGVDLPEMFAHAHEVGLEAGGILARAFGCERATINSVHYQGIDKLAGGLKVEALADDGLVEAFSGERNQAPILAVQWHPEWRTSENPQSRTFFALLGRALRRLPLIP